jgi:hypothetical protein
MNKKVLIIGGGIVVIGAGAYLYFMNKSKKEALLSGGTLATQPSATPTTGTPTTGVGASPINSEIPPLSTGGIVTSTTKATTIEEQIKLDKANDIVVKLKDYYQKSALGQIRVNMFQPSISSFIKPSNPYPIMIKKLKDDLLKLGYEYKGDKDGVLVKL